jgi:hypothetical protein
MIALCSKTYYCFGKEDKFSCKGINKRTNQITKEKYMDVLLSKKSGSGTSRGFRSIDNQVYTYLQERAGFSYFYPSLPSRNSSRSCYTRQSFHPRKFGLKQTRRPLVVGSMFGGVITGKLILPFHPETLLHLGFDHFFQTGSGQSHICTCIWCWTLLSVKSWSNISFGVERYFQLYRGQIFYLVFNANFTYIVVEETTDLTQSNWQTYFKDEVSRRTLFDLILKTDHTEEEFENTKGVIKIKGQQHTHTTKDSTLNYRVWAPQGQHIKLQSMSPTGTAH